MEAIPIVAFWCIAAWTLSRQKQALMYLFFASMPFGSFAAIPTGLTGGLTLTPTPIIALLLIARQLGDVQGLTKALDAALKPSGLLPLFLFWLVAGIATAFMPRFFAGTVEIVPFRVTASADTAMLAPTIQNVSQFVYVTISVLAVFAFADMLRAESMRRHALVALCLGAALMIFTGVLDVASQYLPLTSLLELLRTASYALVTDAEVLNSKRVIGLMPEASSFGGLALAFLVSLYFFRRAMPTGLLRNRVAPVLMAALLLLVWLSTSSAAYMGLGFFGAAAAAEWALRLIASGRDPYLRRGLASEFLLGAVAICLLFMVVLVAPRVLAPILQMFDVMVLQKTSSSSFEERSMWTQVSWNALLATHGLGVGLGGTRASNFAVALASNAGLLGAAFYFLFALQSLVVRQAPRGDAKARALLSAIRWSFLPPFFVGLMLAPSADFGTFVAFFYGFAVAIARTRPQEAARPAPLRDVSYAPGHKPSRLITERSAHVHD